ncbi:MAG TPA: hypothetical protein VHO02_02185 [Fibrobacteria bacterium]|jgi:hypothetical protein|nr:hypothetical protein [Fibrobacteria bacterium]
MSINLQNLQWKLHLDEATVGDHHDWFKVFATWIVGSPEVFVDVADYSHVTDGPVIFLSGHNEAYTLDKTTGRHGLLYERRQPVETANPETLKASLKTLLAHASLVENDATFKTKPKFLAGDLKFIVNNRAIAPNNDETFAALKPELSALLDGVYGAGNYTLTREQDARQRFSVYVKAKSDVTVADALKKLG